MVTTTREVQSDKRAITKEDVLKMIVRLTLNNGKPLFFRPHLDREYVLGLVGDRGGGKSGSSAVISIIDFMLRGKPVWSNMLIGYDVYVSDELAQIHGLNSGGVVRYESIMLEKDKLLKLDETYRDGCLVIEEINVQFSNVRRFMSNTNIESNELYQQLRKFKTSLIYNVIDEMFVDPQLRTLTDIFIRSYDTAFDTDALARKKPTGIDFCWNTFAYSSYLNGEQGRYSTTKRGEKCYFHFKPWHGVYDSMQHQEKGVYSLSKREREKLVKQGLLVESSEEIKDQVNKWKWLEDIAINIKNMCVKNGGDSLFGWELANAVGLPLTRDIKEALKLYGIQYDPNIQAYRVNIFAIEKGLSESRGERDLRGAQH